MKSDKTREKPFDMKLFFAALADDTRLRLLNLMGETEVCVCYLVEIIGTNQPKISRHLAYLRRAGIVAARRDGIWSHYRIIIPEDEYAANAFRGIQSWLRNDHKMQRDIKKMMKICCAPSPQQPVGIQGAPKPQLISV